MGFFSQIIGEARQEDEERLPYLREPQPADGQIAFADAPMWLQHRRRRPSST